MRKRVTNSKGDVAVIISPGYGAGFHTWNDIPELCFCPVIINHMLLGTLNSVINEEEFIQSINSYYGLEKDNYICTMGLFDAEIVWIPKGTAFLINEYDGSESINYIKETALIA